METVVEENREAIRSATHHLRVSKPFFYALCGAICELSTQRHDLYSFRRLLGSVLVNPLRPLYAVNADVLDGLCQAESVSGDIHLTVRIDSRHNDLLREFREHAELQLGRPVSVAEAMRVCVFTITDK